jgi:hypothetical protein
MSVTSPYNPASGGRNGAPAGPAGQAGQAPSVTGDRLPRPPRRRRPGFAALAVLLIAGAAAAAGLLAVQLDERVPVLVARTAIPVGQQIQRDDLAIARVASGELKTISTQSVNSVVGRYATETIAAGRLIEPGMLGDQSLLARGSVALGVILKPGNVPASGVRTGDRVKVYRSKDGVGTLLASDAIVDSVRTQDGGSRFGGGGGGSGDAQATIIVRDDAQASVSSAIAGASLAGQLVLGLTERGGDVTVSGGEVGDAGSGDTGDTGDAGDAGTGEDGESTG